MGLHNTQSKMKAQNRYLKNSEDVIVSLLRKRPNKRKYIENNSKGEDNIISVVLCNSEGGHIFILSPS